MQFGFNQINNFKEISEDILEIFSDLELHGSVDFRVGGEWIIYYKSGGADYIKSPDEINGKILRFVPSPWSWETKKVMKIEKGFTISYKIEVRITDKGGTSVQFLSNLTTPIIMRIKNAYPGVNLENVLTFETTESGYDPEQEYSPEDWPNKTKLNTNYGGGYKFVRGANFYFEIYKDKVINPNEAKDEVWDILSNLELEYKNIDLFSWKAVEDTIVYKFELTQTPSSDELYKIFETLDSLISRSENSVGVKFKRIELFRNLESRNIGLWWSDSKTFGGKVEIRQFTVVFEC